MAVSEHDKRYMKKLGEFSAELEKEPLPPWSKADREWYFAWVNERRAEIGLPPFVDEGVDHEPRDPRERTSAPSNSS